MLLEIKLPSEVSFIEINRRLTEIIKKIFIRHQTAAKKRENEMR